MATPLIVRNSFHMLPIEEKNYRRAQYARSRSGAGGRAAVEAIDSGLPSLPEHGGIDVAELAADPAVVDGLAADLPADWLPLSAAPDLTLALPSSAPFGAAGHFDVVGSARLTWWLGEVG